MKASLVIFHVLLWYMPPMFCPQCIKTLQYLMGHSDVGVTLNTYTHLGLEDAADELKWIEELADARKELEKVKGETPVSQKMFRAI